jgi:hypothetical protein
MYCNYWLKKIFKIIIYNKSSRDLLIKIKIITNFYIGRSYNLIPSKYRLNLEFEIKYKVISYNRCMVRGFNSELYFKYSK